jgi:hypothetical protein
MEAETYPLRLKRFPFLGWFDGTVVSGREGVAKPEPAVFTRLLDRFGLKPRMTLMIDAATMRRHFFLVRTRRTFCLGCGGTDSSGLVGSSSFMMRALFFIRYVESASRSCEISVGGLWLP